MQHKWFFVFTLHGIDYLLVPGRTQGGEYNGLGFAAGELGRTMGPGHVANLYGNWSYRHQFAAINPWVT